MRIRLPILPTMAVLALTGAAAAQTGPSSSTETYGDWTRRCSAIAVSEDQSEWRCEMVQSVQLRDTGQTLLEVAAGRLEAEGPIIIVFQVPNSVWLRTPIGIAFGEDPEAENVETASYFRCTPQVCLADLEIGEDLLDGLMSEEILMVSVEDGNRRTIRIPMSLNGFDEAYDATFLSEAPVEAEDAEDAEGGE